jgi:cobalt/nickel transport system permease protein
MHVHLADQYRPSDSFVHRLDPRIKVIVVLTFILTASLLPAGAYVSYLLLLVSVWLAAHLSCIGLGYTLKRSVIALPFALAALTLPFTVPGETLFTVPMFGGLNVSVEGTLRLFSIVIKSWISVQAAILLVATTSFPDLLWALSALHVPGPLVAIVGFMYRYLFVLSDEALRMTRARAARSADGGKGRRASLLWRGKVTGRMIGTLMLRSLERSERIYEAMLARGFRGQVRTLAHQSLRRTDYMVIVSAVAFCGLTLFVGRVFQLSVA